MFLYIPSKTKYNTLFKNDPFKTKKKTLTINYLDTKGKTIEGKYIENSEVRIDNLEKLNSAFYGRDSKTIEVTEILCSMLTLKKQEAVKKIRKDVKAVLWKPSGGLGHCLHNLAWAYKFCVNHNSKLYLYGLDKYVAYQETFQKTLQFTDTRVQVEELRDANEFIKKYNIHEKYYNVIRNANYKTNLKYISDDNSLAFVCGTARVSVKNLIRIKAEYLYNVLNNPYKYYKNDYNIISVKGISIEKQKSLVDQIIKSKDYISVHYRGRDKKVQGGMQKKLSEVKQACKETKTKNVFVASDNPKFFDYLCEQEKNLTFFRYTSPPIRGNNIHFNNTDFVKGENLYKTVLDMFTCKKSKQFIPSIGSGFSNIAREFNFEF